MGLKTEKLDKVLELFYENPSTSFTIREVSKLTKLPKSTLQLYLVYFKKNKLITEKNKAVNESIVFKVKKINYYIEQIAKSGIIEYFVSKLNPSCIILFGSIRKGESSKESDIDIFIESPTKKELNLMPYEKRLKHRIQLFIETDMQKLQPQLFNNVVNGIKLYGSFKVK